MNWECIDYWNVNWESVDYRDVNWEWHRSEGEKKFDDQNWECVDYRNVNWESIDYRNVNWEWHRSEGKGIQTFDDQVMEMRVKFTHSLKIYSEPPTEKNNFSGKDIEDNEGGSPHDGLVLALSHLRLGVRDLLSVQLVCKSLCYEVQNDPLLWRNIHIDLPSPYSSRLTDDLLLQLTNRAQGSLKSLYVASCPNITTSGIERVLRSNPGLTKLGVPGCTRLRVDGIISQLKAMKSAGKLVIKNLRVGKRFNITQKHFEEMKYLLAVDNECMQQLSARRPRFYGKEQEYLSFDDDRAIDIETCPKCQEVQEVFDCPAESCQSMKNACRGCILCISRCRTCGCCIGGRRYIESFFFDFLCFNCLKITGQIKFYIGG